MEAVGVPVAEAVASEDALPPGDAEPTGEAVLESERSAEREPSALAEPAGEPVRRAVGAALSDGLGGAVLLPLAAAEVEAEELQVLSAVGVPRALAVGGALADEDRAPVREAVREAEGEALAFAVAEGEPRTDLDALRSAEGVRDGSDVGVTEGERRPEGAGDPEGGGDAEALSLRSGDREALPQLEVDGERDALRLADGERVLEGVAESVSRPLRE